MDTGKNNVVILLYGSFNPPTVMHKNILYLAKNKLTELGYNVIEGYVSPVHDAYKKFKPSLISSEHRLAMLKITFANDPWITVKDFEVIQNGWTPAVAVVRYYANELDNAKLIIIMGSDALFSMLDDTVWNPLALRTLLCAHEFVIVIREDANQFYEKINNSFLERYKNKLIVVENNEDGLKNVSSTLVRKCINNGENIESLVSENVSKYIYDNHLYKD